MEYKCLDCKKDIIQTIGRGGKKKYCNEKCKRRYLKYYWKNKNKILEKKKQSKCLDCGKNIVTNYKRCKKCSHIGELSNIWKGDKVGYGGVHAWVKSHKIKSLFCEKCGKITDKLDLANISGEYKRDIMDFRWLCRKCHMAEDGRSNNFWRNSPTLCKINELYNKKRKHYGI